MNGFEINCFKSGAKGFRWVFATYCKAWEIKKLMLMMMVRRAWHF